MRAAEIRVAHRRPDAEAKRERERQRQQLRHRNEQRADAEFRARIDRFELAEVRRPDRLDAGLDDGREAERRQQRVERRHREPRQQPLHGDAERRRTAARSAPALAADPCRRRSPADSTDTRRGRRSAKWARLMMCSSPHDRPTPGPSRPYRLPMNTPDRADCASSDALGNVTRRPRVEQARATKRRACRRAHSVRRATRVIEPAASRRARRTPWATR